MASSVYSGKFSQQKLQKLAWLSCSFNVRLLLCSPGVAHCTVALSWATTHFFLCSPGVTHCTVALSWAATHTWLLLCRPEVAHHCGFELSYYTILSVQSRGRSLHCGFSRTLTLHTSWAALQKHTRAKRKSKTWVVWYMSGMGMTFTWSHTQKEVLLSGYRGLLVIEKKLCCDSALCKIVNFEWFSNIFGGWLTADY